MTSHAHDPIRHTCTWSTWVFLSSLQNLSLMTNENSDISFWWMLVCVTRWSWCKDQDIKSKPGPDELNMMFYSFIFSLIKETGHAEKRNRLVWDCKWCQSFLISKNATCQLSPPMKSENIRWAPRDDETLIFLTSIHQTTECWCVFFISLTFDCSAFQNKGAAGPSVSLRKVQNRVKWSRSGSHKEPF